jgi:hypothetical protein
MRQAKWWRRMVAWALVVVLVVGLWAMLIDWIDERF